MRVIYRKIRHARYLYIKRNAEKVWGARYTLGARYLSKNAVISIVYSECVFVALGIQLAKRMRPIILSSMACPARHYSSK